MVVKGIERVGYFGDGDYGCSTSLHGYGFVARCMATNPFMSSESMSSERFCEEGHTEAKEPDRENVKAHRS